MSIETSFYFISLSLSVCVCTPNATELRSSFFLCVYISGFFQERGKKKLRIDTAYAAHEKSQKRRAKVKDEGS